MIKLKSLLEIEGTEPHVYYHVTFKSNLKKIQKYGIKPRMKATWQGDMGQDIRESKGVYLFENKYDALKWAFRSVWHFKKEVAILKIHLQDTSLVKDTHWEAGTGIGDWVVYDGIIDPSSIVEVIPFTEKSWSPELTQKINAIEKSKRQSND